MGLPEEKGIPHGFTKSGSVNLATPGESETRLTCGKRLKLAGEAFSNAGVATTVDTANGSIHRPKAHSVFAWEQPPRNSLNGDSLVWRCRRVVNTLSRCGAH